MNNTQEFTITDVDTDGTDFGIYFEVAGKECSFHWDSENLLTSVLHGLSEEEVIEAFEISH